MRHPTASGPENNTPPVARTLRGEVADILSVRGPERAERLLAATRLASIVPLLPPEEFFFTLKEMDPADSRNVLAHASTAQVEFFADLELWDRDRLRVDRVLPWLQRLAECGDPAIARWLTEFDATELVLLLGALARVKVASDEEDPFQDADGRAPFTLDGLYYIFAARQTEPLVRRLLTVFRERAGGEYPRLMEGLIRDVGAELEEHCYQERLKRLSARGFPEWEEALEVFSLLEAEDARGLPLHSDGNEVGGESSAIAPQYPVVAAGTAPELLQRALHLLAQRGGLERFHTELAYLTNQVAVADRLDLDRISSFEAALRKVAACTSIGLEVLCGPDADRAAELLSTRWLQHLFRVGWTRLRKARRRARDLFRHGWPQGRKERLLFLDSPLPEILEGLLRAQPLRYSGEAEPPPYQMFRTLGEVEQAERDTDKAEFLGRFLLKVVDLRLEDLKGALLHLESDNLKGSTIFLTALVNAALDLPFRFSPVARAQVPSALARVWVGDRPPRRIRPEFIAAAVEWSRSSSEVTTQEEAYLREFVESSLALLEDEFGHLAPGETPDPRFTRGIWIQ